MRYERKNVHFIWTVNRVLVETETASFILVLLKYCYVQSAGFCSIT